MATMSIPTFVQYFRENEARQTTEQLTQLLRFAHQESIFKRQPVTVGIDFETNSYFIRIDPGPRDWDWELKRKHQTPLPKGFEFEEIVYPDLDEEEDSGVAYIAFYPDGTAQKARLSINRMNEKGNLEQRYVLRVNHVTGQVRVREKRYDDDSYF
jgi:Tfp pilus assembly protein FimT